MILAPLRGVTIRAFRETFADEIAAAGFTEAVTPFIPAAHGGDPLKDRELIPGRFPLLLTPQFIGKDPSALGRCLTRIREAGFKFADLNCGCPFPMVRNKGRGSGLLKSPRLFEAMLKTGVETMGPGRFSIKTRLGIDRTDELLALMPVVNAYPLRFLAVHARTARQMYSGACDWNAYAAIVTAAKVPVVPNGDLPFPPERGRFAADEIMIGRGFIRALGAREDSPALIHRYLDASAAELKSEHAVLGRIKELVAYFRESPFWARRWPIVKIARTLNELRAAIAV